MSEEQQRPHQDPGLQPERTALAWNRTVLALIVLAATQARWASTFPPLIVVPIAVIIVLVVAIVVTGRDRYRRAADLLASRRQAVKAFPILAVGCSIAAIGIFEVVMIAPELF